MGDRKKITIEVPADILRKAQEVSGKGITATVRAALERLASRDAYDAIRRLRGSVEFTEDLDSIREDRT